MKKISRLQVTAWVLSLLPAAMTAAFYSRLPAEIPMQWDLGGHVGYETRWHLWIVAGMAPLFAVLFYFLPRFDPKSKNYEQIFRCLYRVPDHDRPVPDRNVRHLYCGSTASGYGRCADSRMSARQPAGDVPRQHYAEVSHELVLRDSKRRGRCRAKLSGRKRIVRRAACCLRRVLSVRQARSFRTKLQSLCWCLRQWRRQRLSRLC